MGWQPSEVGVPTLAGSKGKGALYPDQIRTDVVSDEETLLV